MRARLELAALAAVLLASAAFVLSFAFGLGRPGGARTGDVAASPPRREAPDAPIAAGRVEVLNAARRAGVARHATDRLRDAGFDVVYFGNAPASASGDSSVVIDRVGRPDIVAAVAGRLGIARTTVALDSSLYLDATVILGADYSATSGSEPRAVPDSDAASLGERLRRLIGR